MVQLLSDYFGPYPFEEYGVVVADTQLGFSLETQTLSLFGSNIGASRAGEETAVHELAHQWFGDSVSLEQWKDIWLNEGFATYGQWLWIEQNEGEQALISRLRQTYHAVLDEHAIPPGNPPADNLFNPGVYLRGGLTLQALRAKVGDEAFFRILKTYAARFRHGNATTADFINVSDEVSGQNMSAFLNAWLYDPQMPDISELLPAAPPGTALSPTAGATP
jgi:aminopeptidase N